MWYFPSLGPHLYQKPQRHVATTSSHCLSLSAKITVGGFDSFDLRKLKSWQQEKNEPKKSAKSSLMSSPMVSVFGGGGSLGLRFLPMLKANVQGVKTRCLIRGSAERFDTTIRSAVDDVVHALFFFQYLFKLSP
jgi:hypothetical protein